MHKLAGIVGIKIKEKWLAILAIIGLVGLLAPLLRLALYAVPYYDDYMHLSFPRSFLLEYGGIGGWLQGVLVAVKSQYYAWQGTYSTQFIVSASPLILDEKYYGYAVIVVFLLFVLAVMAFVLITTKRIMGMDPAAGWLAAVIVTASLVELIHTAQQGIYWYNGEVHYTLMHGLMLFMLAVAVEIYYCRTTISAVLLAVFMTVLGIIVAGSNFVTILQGLLLLLTIICLGILFHKKRTFFLIVPTICYIVAFYINVSAPGNEKRGQAYQGYGVLKSILYSFKSAFEQFGELTGVMMLVFLLLLLPVIWNAVRKMKYQFRLPGLVTLYSICLYATGFTSSYYAMGTPGLGRTWVAVKFTLQLLLYVNEIYWVGWLIKRRQRKQEVSEMRHFIFYYAALGLVALGIFTLSPNQAGSYSSFGAYYYIHTGEAYNFYLQYQDRIEKIENGDSVVALEPYVWKPYFLCIGDLSTDPTAQQNTSMANWYGKEAVYIIMGEESD